MLDWPTVLGESNQRAHKQGQAVEIAHVLKIGVEIPPVFVDAYDRDQLIAEVTGAIGYGYERGALFKALAPGYLVPEAVRKRTETLHAGLY